MLHERYAAQGLSILLFPCNQFGGQEPGTAEEIAAFAGKWGPALDDQSWVLFKKGDVNGSGARPAFAWLKERLTSSLGDSIKWNFTKFLVARDGRAAKRYGPKTSPLSFDEDVRSLLAGTAIATPVDPVLLDIAKAMVDGVPRGAGVPEAYAGVEICDRTYHLKTYKACLLGCELVTWLVEHGYAPDRGAAVALGRQLGEAQLLRHVVGQHDFKDEGLFYHCNKQVLPMLPGQPLPPPPPSQEQ